MTDHCVPPCPHVPAHLWFEPNLTDAAALKLAQQKRLPTTLPFGPTPAPQDWGPAMETVELAIMADYSTLSEEQAQRLADDAYATFMDTAEKELLDFLGLPLEDANCKRSLPPSLRAVPAIDRPTDQPPRHPEQALADNAKWLLTRAKDLALAIGAQHHKPTATRVLLECRNPPPWALEKRSHVGFSSRIILLQGGSVA